MKENKDWKERFNKEVEEDKSMGGTLYLHKWIPNFIEQLISERDKEWYKNLELCTAAISEDGKVRFVRINEPDFTNKLQTLNK